MSRLEKKCVLTSAAVHLLLVAVLLLGPAFISSRDQTDRLPVLDVIPARLVDDALAGGGNPLARPPPSTPVIPREAVAPTPLPPVVVQPRRASEPVPEPPEPEHRVRTRNPPHLPQRVELKPSPAGTEPPPQSPRERPKRDLNLDKIVRGPSAVSSARERARREARAREAAAAAQAARRAEIASAVQSIRQNLSPGIQVDVPGPGGEAYANYGLVVRSIYDQAWILPDGVTDDSLTVQVLVTIARDGSVVAERTRIQRRSGSTVVDRSVQRALDRVKFIGPFPPGAKELEREFIINFNVKAKRSLG